MADNTRRGFLKRASGGTTALLGGSRLTRAAIATGELDSFIEAEMRAQRIPGLAACIIKSGKVAWSKGYGWADIKRRAPMDPVSTIQNIGSISKTVTATAAMQLWEKGKFDLEDDVNRHLPFAVRNPAHSGMPVTVRQLLTHRSSIADGPAYGSSYACGDPGASLEEWVRGYFTPGGRHYRENGNFHAWEPGEKHHYSNLGFGLLGYLVERASGEPFHEYTRRHITEPLKMTASGWMLGDVDAKAHAVPYVPVDDGKVDEDVEAYRKAGLLAGPPERGEEGGRYQPLCLYGFPNYPDGAFRTGVNELARFLLAYMNEGIYDGARILEAETVRLMLTRQHATPPHQGLCWATLSPGGRKTWGHNGSDPGIRTNMAFRPSDGAGVIVFVNRAGLELTRFNERLFREADRF